MKINKIIGFIFLVTSLSACVTQKTIKGHIELNDEEQITTLLDEYKSGGLLIDKVISILGAPETIVNNQDGSQSWLYIATENRYQGFLKPKVRRVFTLKIQISDNGKILKLDHNNEKANKMDYAGGKTPIMGDDSNIAKEILGNIGKFNPKK